MVLSNTPRHRPAPTRSYSCKPILLARASLLRHVDANNERKPPSTSTSPISLSAKPTLSSSSPPPPSAALPPRHARFTQRTPHSDAIEWAALPCSPHLLPYLFGYFNVWLLILRRPRQPLLRAPSPARAAPSSRSRSRCLLLLMFGLPVHAFHYPGPRQRPLVPPPSLRRPPLSCATPPIHSPPRRLPRAAQIS